MLALKPKKTSGTGYKPEKLRAGATLLMKPNRILNQPDVVVKFSSGGNVGSRPWIYGEHEEPSPVKSNPSQEVLLPRWLQAYYDPKSTTFWIPATGGGWTRVKSIDDYLKVDGKIPKDQVSLYRLRVQQQRSLIYVGPLSGRRPGIVETKEGLALVTSSFNLIEPRQGDWSFIRRWLEGRLGQEQLVHLYAYLKLGYEHLRDGKLSPGLFLAVTGKTGMHKTATQELIVTPILGGRTAEPWQYLTAGSPQEAGYLILAYKKGGGRNDSIQQ